MVYIYDFFDDIVCITLTTSNERRSNAENVFKALEIPGRLFVTEKHEKGGLYGCFDSHIQIIQNAYKNGLNHLLVFEDDFMPSASYSEEKLSEAIEFMKSSDDWDIFYLGYCSVFETHVSGTTTILSGQRLSKHISQYNAGNTHALCYSRKAMKKILDTYQDYIGILHYDQYLSSYAEMKNYCILPMIFQQNLSFSYNIEGQHGLEIINRLFYPIDAFLNVNYNISKLHYDLTTNVYSRYYKYIFLTIVSVFLHMIKRSIVKNIMI